MNKLEAKFGLSRTVLGILFVFGVLTAMLFAAGRRDYPNLHIILDTGIFLMSAILALLFWDMSRYLDNPFTKYLAISFAVTSVLNFIHAIVTVEWSGPFIPITQAANVLRPGTWPPSVHALPIGVISSIWLMRKKKRYAGWFTIMMVLLSAGFLVLFNYLPRYTASTGLGITRPALILPPFLWGMIMWQCWRRRREDRLLPALMLMSVVLALANIAMLYSRTPHDTEAMVAHLGRICGFVVVVMAVMQFAATDTGERIRAEKRLAQMNEELERRVVERTAQINETNKSLEAEMTARKQAEQVNARLAAIVQSSDDAIIGKTLDGIITSWNHGAEKLFGYSAEEALGKPMLMVFPPDRIGEEHDIMERITRGKTVSHFETVRVTKDKKLIDVSVTISPVLDESGKIIGASKIARDITERKQTEEALRQSELKFARAFANNPAAIALTRLDDGRVLEVNDTWVALCGFSRAEIIGRSARIIWPSPEAAADFVRELRDKGVVRGWEQAFQKKSGEIFVAQLSSQLLTIDGEMVILSTLVDITERKRAEEALHQSQNHLRIVTENARVGLVMVNYDRRYTFANGAYAEILGLPSADIVGQRIADVLAPLYEEQICPRLDRAFAGERVTYELRKPAADGDYFYVVKYEPTKVDGSVSLVVVVITDITDQKRAQKELVWKTTFLEAQVDSALDAILVVNDRAKVILKNQHLAKLFKIPDDIARDDDDNKMLQYVTSQMKDPKQFIGRVQYLYEHPDEISRDEIELANGTILDRYSSPVRDKAGKHYGRIWTFRDITERRKLEAQFHQSQKMEGIGQLAGGVAHDFNNILAIIQMQAELLKGSAGLTAEQSEFASEIGITVQRAAALTRQLLLFSRREVFQPVDLDLSSSITNMAKMLKRVLSENIDTQIKLASQPIFIHADAAMLDQVLLNLCVNARDAMPEGGQLIIETSAMDFDEFAATQSPQIRPGSFVCLSVSDSGCGIPPEILPKIFEPFFTTKGVGKGTGLGLATVFGIVQQHQGWVNVYSEVGHGTTFRIYLPRLATGAQTSSSSTLSTMHGGTETILLVEDDPALRKSVHKGLSRLGYTVLEAANGVKALEVWKQSHDKIHLLLTDMMMPDGMSGRGLAKQLLQENPKLKVIYMSGYSAEVAGKDFPLEEGVNFLTKPFQAFTLAQIIRNMLDK